MDHHKHAASFADADAEFAAAWQAPGNTRFELPPVDVNGVLAARYALARPFRMTRTQLWDMEVKKAWDPKSYIPYVASQGSSWGRQTLADGSERFYRASVQKAWIHDETTQVLEEVFIEPLSRRVLFMGRNVFPAETGQEISTGTIQPVFHVEHGAGGTEQDPANTWRIVFLTANPDPRLLVPFEEMVAAGRLPGFIEIYIERDLGIRIS